MTRVTAFHECQYFRNRIFCLTSRLFNLFRADLHLRESGNWITRVCSAKILIREIRTEVYRTWKIYRECGYFPISISINSLSFNHVDLVPSNIFNSRKFVLRLVLSENWITEIIYFECYSQTWVAKVSFPELSHKFHCQTFLCIISPRNVHEKISINFWETPSRNSFSCLYEHLLILYNLQVKNLYLSMELSHNNSEI